MSNKWAYTNLQTGECVHVMETSLNFNYGISEGDSDGSGNLIHSLNGISDWEDYPATKYWNGQWEDKPVRPSGYYLWSLSGWVFNSERFWEDLRNERNLYLSQSDWTQMNDSPLSNEKKLSWSEYRQDLRDLPELLDDVQSLDDVPWPTKPE